MKRKLLTTSLFIAASVATYAQWSAGGTQISFTPDNHHRPFVSVAAKGSYYIVWQATDTTASQLSKIKVSAYDSTGKILPGWSVGGDTTTHDKGDYYGAQLITSEDGGVIVAWYGYPAASNRSHIYAQKYSYTGVALWNSGAPVQVSTGTSYVDEYPRIVTDKHNGFFVTWNQFDSVIDASSAKVYLQHIDSTGKVANGWNANATGVATISGTSQYYPKLALTPDDSSIYVTYGQGLVGSTELMLNKYKASNGALATGWTSTPLEISTGPNVYPDINHDLWLYADGSNNAIVIWIEAVYTANGEIYMQQVSPSGSILIGTSGDYLFGDTTSGANGVDYLQVIQEPDYNLLIAYNNLVTNNDVAAMKVEPNGTVLWNDSLVTKGGYSAYPYPASDGKKGVYLFYVNTNTPEKLYALAIDSSGKAYKGWALPGTAYGTESNYDGFEPNYDVNAVSTINNEAIVAWNRVGTFYDIFTCNLLNNGMNCISPNGIDEVTSNNDSYTLYPNPAKDKLFIEGTFEGNKLLSVYNVVGQQVISMEGQGKQVVLNTSALSTGMYFVQVKEELTGKISVLKFIKE